MTMMRGEEWASHVKRGVKSYFRSPDFWAAKQQVFGDLSGSSDQQLQPRHGENPSVQGTGI